MAATKNYYKILGVEKNASTAEIKKRYRELAKKHHPDVNNGSKKAENNFKILSAAYDVLSDKKKRQEYDRQRAQRPRPSRPRPGPAEWADPGAGFGENQEQRWRTEQDFGGGAAQQEEPVYDPEMPTRGFDLQFLIDLPIETVALGGEVPYSYEKYVRCEECEGTGRIDGAECGVCRGKRLTVAPVTITVAIPPGVADQYTIRIPEAGGEGKNGGPPGDLMLKVNMQKHPHFKRVKSDIHTEVKIPRDLAESGGPLEVDTLEGKQTIQVEDGTLTGEEIRIPGAGAAILWGKKRGDLVIKFKIVDEENV